MPKDNFYTVKKVADRLQLHQRTIYRYIKSKKLTATNIGGWRIYEKDLQDFIKRSSNLHNVGRAER